MPLLTTKGRTVNYRLCEIETTSGPNLDLQRLLKAAESTPGPWQHPLNPDGSVYQQLDRLVEKGGCLCGTITRFTPGKYVPLVGVEDGKIWKGMAPPKDTENKPRNLQDACLAFAVLGNHVAVVRPRELDIRDLNDFLIWFVQKGDPAACRSILLRNIPSQKAREKLKRSNIRAVELDGKTFKETVGPAPPGISGKKGRPKKVRVVECPPVQRQLLGVLMGGVDSGAILDRMCAKADPGSVSISIKVSYRSRSEKDGQEILGGIADTFGGDPDLAPTIHLAGKSKIDPEELHVAGTVNVLHEDGIMSDENAMAQISVWLESLIRSGEVL